MTDPAHNRKMHLWRQRALSSRAEVQELRLQLLRQGNRLKQLQTELDTMLRKSGMAEYYKNRFIETLSELGGKP